MNLQLNRRVLNNGPTHLPNDDSLLLVTNLCKSYGNKPVINNFSYDFKSGVYGVIGPNGVGKSTLLSLIVGILKADSGDVFINGVSIQSDNLSARTMLGFVPDVKALYPFMTGNELIELVCVAKSLKDEKQVLSIIDAFSLKQYLRMSFGEMSEGMRHKFAITSALLGNSVVLVLDEPTNALDKKSVDFLSEEILRRQRQSVILFATHDVDFLESVNATRLNAQTLFIQ